MRPQGSPLRIPGAQHGSAGCCRKGLLFRRSVVLSIRLEINSPCFFAFLSSQHLGDNCKGLYSDPGFARHRLVFSCLLKCTSEVALHYRRALHSAFRTDIHPHTHTPFVYRSFPKNRKDIHNCFCSQIARSTRQAGPDYFVYPRRCRQCPIEAVGERTFGD
jgi:hypothetical protein